MKYWVYLNAEVPGCYPPEELIGLTGFTATTLICPAEGEIQDKNWRHAAEFTDVIKALQSPNAPKHPASAATKEAFQAANANEFIDSTGAKLFRHVASLVGDLEHLHEESSLATALQKQILDVKEELTQAHAREDAVQAKMDEAQDSLRQTETQIEHLENDLAAREQSLKDSRSQIAKSTSELDSAKRKLQDTTSHLAIRNKLVEKLSQELSEKEASLSKALEVIKRMEQEMARLATTENKPFETVSDKPQSQSHDEKVRSVTPETSHVFLPPISEMPKHGGNSRHHQASASAPQAQVGSFFKKLMS